MLAASCPEELGQINICHVCDGTFKLLFDALASSTGVRALSILIEEDPQEKAPMLCNMLRANRSIRRIDIVMQNDKGRFVQELVNALDANEGISELTMTSVALAIETASALSDFFARNRTVAKFGLSFLGLNFSRFVKELIPGTMMNPVIVELQIRALCNSGGRCYFPFAETLQRNRAALNRAIDFVVLRIKNRVGAEAFELLGGTPCFLAHLMKASGQTEREAMLAVASAENFLLDNYLIITRIVQRSLVC